MVSRFLCLIPFALACSAADPVEEREVYISSPPGEYGADVAAPRVWEPPTNCVLTHVGPGPDGAIWICELIAPSRPGDPEPKNVGDPLR